MVVNETAPRKFFAKHLLRKVFLEDWGLKLFALVITLALWFAVTGLRTPTTTRLTVPLNLNVSSDAQITNTPIQEIGLEIRGDKQRVDEARRAGLSASLDLTDMPAGDRIVSLSPAVISIPLPQGVEITEVTPSRIAVNLEAVAEKEIEVKVDTKGQPVTGFEIYTTSVLPPKIRVRGPASVVNILEYVQTDKIDIAGKKEDFSGRQVAVSSPNPQVSMLNTFVDVFFRVGEKRVERMFSIPVADYPEHTATFVLYGPRSLLSRAKSDILSIEMTQDEVGSNVPRVILPVEWRTVVEIRELIVKP